MISSESLVHTNSLFGASDGIIRDAIDAPVIDRVRRTVRIP